MSKQIQAIVYTSETGFTKQYAELLKAETGLPVYEFKKAGTALSAQSEIIYLGWLFAGKIKNYKKAAAAFQVKAVCGVGMMPTGEQLDDLRKANQIPAETAVFSLQGGYAPEKLHGLYKLLMAIMAKLLIKSITAQKAPAPGDEDRLKLLQHGGNLVRKENLKACTDWFFKE